MSVTCLVAACGSTSITDISGPDDVRCAASITADPNTVPAAGGTVTVAVVSERDCTWTASSDASWLVVRSASGQGSGSFTATAARNDLPSGRAGSILLNEQRLTVTQEGRACTFSLQPPAAPLPAGGGPGTIQVSTITGCAWTVTSSAPWLVPRTTAGSGAGAVPFDVQPNTGPVREASVTIGGQSVVVVQASPASACTFVVAPQSRDFAVDGGEATVNVITAPGCAWNVTGGAPWTTVLTSSGTGSGQARYRVAANTSTIARQTTLTVAGRVHTISQPGVACTFAIAPDSRAFTAAGGSGTVQVSTSSACGWSATSNAGWVLLTGAAGAGNGEVAYQVLPNALPDARTARVTIGGHVHTVTQDAAAACTYQIEPPSRAFGAEGGVAAVRVNTQPGCAWTAVSAAEWVTVAPQSAAGSGTADISYTVAANGAAAERAGSIAIAGLTHAVTQAAAAPACSYSIDPAARGFGADGGAAAVRVVTQPGCAWNAVSTVDWVVVNPQAAAGTGTADIAYTVAQNAAAAERAGGIAIAGLTHAVTQAAAAPVCTYSLDPPARDFPAQGGTEVVRVNTQPGCPWSAASTVPWATVAPESLSGTGTADITYTVAANESTEARAGTLVIESQSHSITQAAAALVARAPLLSPAGRRSMTAPFQLTPSRPEAGLATLSARASAAGPPP